MPQFGAANELPTFPTWATPAIRARIGRHPHPSTNRVDGKLCWPSDALLRSLATRNYGQIRWATQQPAPAPADYPNWENVWWDWEASDAAEVFSWIGPTSSGRKCLARIRHYATMPIMGIPGTEFYYEAFKDDVSLGIRTIEMPDDTDAWQYNSSAPDPAPIAGTVTPPKDDPIGPGEWFWLTTNATSECWRWWNTARVVFCPYESDPAGMASLAATISGWGWGQNNYDGFAGKTPIQRLFAEKINQRHILSPIYHPTQGWLPCEVQYQSPYIWDPQHQSFMSPFGGAHYGFSIQAEFRDGRWLAFVHIRVLHPSNETTWEPWTSRALSSGLFNLVGINGGLMNAFQVIPNPPYESRNADQYDFRTTLFNTPAIGPFGINPMDEGIIEIGETTPAERGDEPPQGAPLDMLLPSKQLIAQSSLTGNINGMTPLTWDNIIKDTGNYVDTNGDISEILIPPDVTQIRLVAQCEASEGKQLHQVRLHAKTGTLDHDLWQWIWQDWTGGLSRTQISSGKLDVTPGQILQVQHAKWQNNATGNLRTNWVNLEAVSRQKEILSLSAIKHDEQIPAAGTEIWIATIPPILNNYEITHLRATLGNAKSPTQDLMLALAWMRKTSRVIEDITDDLIQIDNNHWSSDTSASPYTLTGPGKIAQDGDILMLSIQQPAVDAEGLLIDIEFSEPV